MKQEDLSEKWVTRFWSKVDKSGGPDACWRWTAGKLQGRYGYGRASYKGKTVYAHRVAFLLAGGTYTPERPSTLHSCHYPSCVNPAHLRAGSPLENTLDCMEAGRLSCARGERQGRAKLTADKVYAIRALEGRITQRQIGEKFGVSQRLISKIIRKELWRHVA